MFAMRSLCDFKTGKLRLFAVALSVCGCATSGGKAPPVRVMATEQRDVRVVMLKPQTAPDVDSEVVWEWRPSEDPGIPASARSAFDNLDECKSRDGGRTILVTASGGAFAELDTASRSVRAFGIVGGNPHSVERLPDGRYVVASSDGNRLTVVDLNGHPLEPDLQKQVRYPLEFAHGVEWDAEGNCLWAIGMKEIEKLAYDPGTMKLKKLAGYRLADVGMSIGHDLVLESAPGGKLRFTGHEGVGTLDPKSGKMECVEKIPCVKSVSVCGERVLKTVPTEMWWTESFEEGGNAYRIAGARFYKARFFSRAGSAD